MFNKKKIVFSASCSKLAVKLDYLVHLRDAILLPLKEGLDGVDKAVEVMMTYNLLREDFDSLLELSYWSRRNTAIDSKVSFLA